MQKICTNGENYEYNYLHLAMQWEWDYIAKYAYVKQTN